MIRPARNKTEHNISKDKQETDSEYLKYVWSKGYLPTENPKFDELIADAPIK